MPDYIDIPLETDYSTLFSDSVASLQSNVPGWVPSAGNLEVMIMEIMARNAADTADIASAVPTTIFRYFGRTILSLAPYDAQRAAFDAVISTIDAVGYTIPTGSQFFVRDTDGTLYGFETIADVVVPTGKTSVSTVLYAVVAGAAANNLPLDNALGTNVGLITALSYITGVLPQETATSGGADAEDDPTYIGRLVNYIRILAPRPVLAVDYALLLMTTIPGIARATALDGYNPLTATFNNARTVTVAAVDAAGNAISSALKSQAQATLANLREPNFLVFMVDPQYTTVDVTYSVRALKGFDPAAVNALATAALNAYLSPANWGQPDQGDVLAWNLKATVRYFELVQTLANVDGVDYVETLTSGVGGGAQSSVDIVLPGVIPLPSPGVIVGTVDAAA